MMFTVCCWLTGATESALCHRTPCHRPGDITAEQV